MSQDQQRKKKYTKIILVYPVALIIASLLINIIFSGVDGFVVALPSRAVTVAMVLAAVLLLINHTWLMTSTELTRLRYDMHATPEEWAASANSKDDVSDEALEELQRRHNAHRNATENTVHFVFLAILVGLISPVTIAAQVWILGFAVGRLAHTYFYLVGNDNARGFAMSLSLVSLYGLASYAVVSLFV
ncbi:MAPEG family protein [Aliiroseovarius halocynthiae]|uniref:MAPEG family protein n=1 Tax=Aliiroseovarius halocynthiae TaxID=985055 RepID=A0A545SRQ9_9RHOB|nr:MAPEG family protein [Aliiroseovarius halocynthiae]TQV67637.1 MAPEG family protein [Aliiroseovarius halocynthiae]SMR81681.1 MAPEG family protein [Aliiroseovarius halocynthiae]